MTSIKQIFEEELSSICKISPELFYREYNDYKQCLPLLRSLFTDLHQYIHNELPDIEFSLTARQKALKSFLDKKIIKLAENLNSIFSFDKDHTDIQKKAILANFSFLPKEKLEEINAQIMNFNASSVPLPKRFSYIFEQLSDSEKESFIKMVSKTNDTFAYSVTVKNVHYPISDITTLEDGSIGMVQKTNDPQNPLKLHKPLPSVKFNPDTNIIEKSERNIPYVYVNGQEYPLNEQYLVYPDTLPFSKRTLENALRDENGMVTLMQDALKFADGTSYPIESLSFDQQKNTYFVTTPQGDRINLTRALAKHTITLEKYDEKTCQSAEYTIRSKISSFYQTNDLRSVSDKDYNTTPKVDKQNIPYYWALHKIAKNTKYNYDIEGQLRTFLGLLLYDCDHDQHKEARVAKQKQNPFLAQIYKKNKDALDSSTPALMKLLEQHPEIDINDVMGTYFFSTSFANGVSDTYLLDPKMTFIHTFMKYVKTHTSLDPNVKPLDFSSYANYLASVVTRMSEQNLEETQKPVSPEAPNDEGMEL